MAYINWSDRYTVGNPQLDSQHEELFRLINELHQAILARRGREYLAELFEGLGRYVEQHFSAEESHMRRLNHGQINLHQDQHRIFIDTVAELRRKHEGGGGHVGVEAIDFLTRWLIDHIMDWDRRYARESGAQ